MLRRQVENLLDDLTRPRDQLRPPLRKMRSHGDSSPENFRTIGERYLRFFVEFCDLRPEDHVLDVGCGIGRIAIPLTTHLSTGRYEGFDIHAEGIGWCQRNITPRFPNFRFQRADVYNGRYNPRGRQRAAEYHFPYADETFDFVVLTSVFTHMFALEVAHYLSEIARVSRKGARSLITYFLLNPESDALIRDGKSARNFEHQLENCRADSQTMPESAIAFEESFVRDCYRRCGLQLEEPIRYGAWCGREQYLVNQDIVIAVKRPFERSPV